MAQEIYVIAPGIESPAEFITELEMLDVTWDDPDYAGGYLIEGAESVVNKILTGYRESGKVKVLEQFL